MYYKLKPVYILRGWNKMAWTLVQRPRNQVRKLNQKEFQTLLLCDGSTDFESEYISDEIKTVLHQFEAEKIVETCEKVDILMDDQYYHYYDNRFVRSIFWSVTGRCNFRCRHCYMDAPSGSLGELSNGQAIALIDQMAECGVLRVDITGGEPFVRKDFWELVDRILSYKITIGQVYTNGWLINDIVLDEFEKRMLRPEFSISFDGIGCHDWMRGVKGAEEAVVRALELCKKRKFFTDIEMCIHKGNLCMLRESVLQMAKLGVTSMKCGLVAETELWKKNGEGNTLNYRAYVEAMIDYIPHFYEDGMPMNLMLGGVISLYKNSSQYEIVAESYNGTEKYLRHHLCGAVRYSCYITPEGRLLPCMPMTACKEQELFPLVQDIGLKQGLNDGFYMNIVDSRVEDLLAVNTECAACEHKYVCGGGCRASALEQDGDLMGCDRNYCMLWKEGYIDRIREVTEAAIAKYCPNHTENHPNT